jgi:hypothetical protein
MCAASNKAIARRTFLLASSSSLVALAAPSILSAQEAAPVRRNMSSFLLHDWQDHFDSLGKGILLSDTTTRVLQHWTADGEMRIYPTSVPMTDDLTRRGYSEIVYKDEAPDWAPTPSMLKRDPTLPKYVPAGPKNPLGVRAMHLSWQYYRIHGSGDTRKIGRKSSSGCIGLYNEQIIEVFDRTPVGTQVKLI